MRQRQPSEVAICLQMERAQVRAHGQSRAKARGDQEAVCVRHTFHGTLVDSRACEESDSVVRVGIRPSPVLRRNTPLRRSIWKEELDPPAAGRNIVR